MAFEDDEFDDGPAVDDEDEDEGVDVSGTEGGDDAGKRSRAQNRKERGKLFGALQESQAEARRLAEENARLKAYTERARPQQQPQGPDQYEVEIARLLEDDRRLRGEATAHNKAGTLTPELIKELEDKIDLNAIRRQTLIAERTALRVVGSRNTEAEAQRAAIHAQYADVKSNPRAQNWAAATYQQRVLERGDNAEGPELLHEVMQEARSKFGLSSSQPGDGRRGAPSNGDRQRFVSTGGAGLVSGGRPQRTAASSSAELSKTERVMAETMYPTLSAEKAHATFRKHVLSKVASE